MLPTPIRPSEIARGLELAEHYFANQERLANDPEHQALLERMRVEYPRGVMFGKEQP